MLKHPAGSSIRARVFLTPLCTVQQSMQQPGSELGSAGVPVGSQPFVECWESTPFSCISAEGDQPLTDAKVSAVSGSLSPTLESLQAGRLREARSRGLKVGGLGFGIPSSMTDQHKSIMR